MPLTENRLTRREFGRIIGLSTGAALTGCAGHGLAGEGIVDTHTHFYDPSRPQGVPWPPKNDAVLYRPVYPSEFVRLSKSLGVTGTIIVEASPWLEDNQWVLNLAKDNPCVRGVVGNIKPGQDGFVASLKRFARNPLFRGIRVGVWENSAMTDATVLRDLRRLADHNLALDVLIAPDKLPDIALLAATVPALRIVVDHCANVRVDGNAPPGNWLEGLRACATQPNVYMKVSGLVEGTGRSDGTAPSDGEFYRPTLDALWNAFGEDRVIFGSNWPVSARFANYEAVFNLVNNYARRRGPVAARKYFSQNARHAYGLGAA